MSSKHVPLRTSNVAKYKLHSQVETTGAMHGLWVIAVTADNNGNSGPGLVTLSEVRGGGKIFLDEMATVVTTPGKNKQPRREKKIFLGDAPTVDFTLGARKAVQQRNSLLLESDSDTDSDEGGFHIEHHKPSNKIILQEAPTVDFRLGDHKAAAAACSLHLDSDSDSDEDGDFDFTKTHDFTHNKRTTANYTKTGNNAPPPAPPSDGDALPKHTTMQTSNVSKYVLHTQVGQIGDGSMNGWWVAAVKANSGDSGPGRITLSERKLTQREIFLVSMTIDYGKTASVPAPLSPPKPADAKAADAAASGTGKTKKASLLSKGAGMLRSRSLFLHKQNEKLADKQAMNKVAEEQVRLPLLTPPLPCSPPPCAHTPPLLTPPLLTPPSLVHHPFVHPPPPLVHSPAFRSPH
jgi:hypothetical protein